MTDTGPEPVQALDITSTIAVKILPAFGCIMNAYVELIPWRKMRPKINRKRSSGRGSDSSDIDYYSDTPDPDYEERRIAHQSGEMKLIHTHTELLYAKDKKVGNKFTREMIAGLAREKRVGKMYS
jgi:hypothetical protein